MPPTTAANLIPFVLTSPVAPGVPIDSCTPGERYAALYADFCRAQQANTRRLKALSHVENAILNHMGRAGESWLVNLAPPSDYDLEKGRAKLAKGIVSALIAHAEETFAPPGASLSIKRDELADIFQLTDSKAYAAFDATSIWAYLAQTYGGDAGRNAAWTQAAKALVSAFDLAKAPEVRIVAGRHILNLRVWPEERTRGGKELSWNCAGDVFGVFKQLAAFGEWAELPSFAHACLRQINRWDRYRALESRERIALGDGCEYVTYFNRFEFKLASTVAEPLQVFLGTFAMGDAS